MSAQGSEFSRLNVEIDERIDDRIDRYSVTVLGYDRSSADPKPSVLLDWVRKRRDREALRTRRMGAILTAVTTTFLGAIAWPLCQQLLHALGR